ncbi:hypothetical protein [Aromatoleum anaerobium]|uniref:Uncharacterized protein n=1 Tax=Aromatoleum anaerobium TaxID=182180 RepID=A0ABX1PQ99_9RHOO|nr:hypothetical protein [Aromatoleum anaerobium]MCK0508606.1 hypothetical protein [Aromatoleum anaerobium]
MNAALIEALNRATSLELFHLSTILERLMSDPARIIEIRRHLHLGQSVRFLDGQQAGAQMSLRTGQIIAMKDTQLTVQDERSRREWKLPYAAIEIPDTGSIPAQSAPEPPSPTRADFRGGDQVSFEDRHLQTRIGTIVRINQRTATLDCDGQSWRVSFPLLRHLVDL